MKLGDILKEAVSPAQQAAIAISKKERGEKPKISETIKASTMYGVVKGDPKGDGEVVFKGSAKKARSMVKDLQRKGQTAYVINSPSAKVGQRAYHKKGHGLKIEVAPPGREKQVKGLYSAALSAFDYLLCNIMSAAVQRKYEALRRAYKVGDDDSQQELLKRRVKEKKYRARRRRVRG